MKVKALIEDARRYVVGLYDDEGDLYEHWSDEDWLSYLRLAIGMLSASDPATFTEQRYIQLQAGPFTAIPKCCSAVKSVLGISIDDEIIPLRVRHYRSLRIPKIRRHICKTSDCSSDTSEYRPVSYVIDPSDTRTVFIDPPVPKGYRGELVVSCLVEPKLESDDDELELTAVQTTALFEFILYYAWGVDIEDATSRERSAIHFQNALKLLEITDVNRRRQLQRLARVADERIK